jgi:hypothetical protein
MCRIRSGTGSRAGGDNRPRHVAPDDEADAGRDRHRGAGT